MAILKYKKDGVWTELADSFPVDVPIEVTEMDANLGTLTVTQNGSYSAAPTYDAFDKVIANVSVLPSVIRAGDTPVLMTDESARAKSTSQLAATGVKLQIPKAGTYRFKWSINDVYESYTIQTRLYKNGDPVGELHSVSGTAAFLTDDIACDAGDEIEVYVKGYSDYGTYGSVPGLVGCIDWDIWGE